MNWDFPYPSRRMPVLARNAVAASQPLATQAGVEMLRLGGSAMDAALASAIALTVVEPVSNGIGSDAFAIVWDGSALTGLNASGRSPAGWSRERFAGRETMPIRGWDAVTVPGAVSAWVACSERFGRLPFERLFEPAIHYAEQGFPVGPITAAAWASAPREYAGFAEFARVFLPGGRAPAPGEVVRLPEHAATLRRIAASRGEDFYRGNLARAMADCAAAEDGALSAEDLAAHACDWTETIALEYHGYEVHEIPPNGQGLAALQALGILRHLAAGDGGAMDPLRLHLQVEAMKSAFADAHAHLADADAMATSSAALLDDGYLASRAAAIDPARAREPLAGVPPAGGTVYLAAADASGMMVSFIQSNFYGFGSGIVVPGTGIALQNRGYGFTLERGHPNEVGPRKRPFHTIIPGFVMQEGVPFMAFGVMGGSMQPQGHLQVIARMADMGENPQAASDAPRWRIMPDGRLLLEDTMPEVSVAGLEARGHRVARGRFNEFGSGQFICRLPGGGYCAASDSRKEGQAAGF